MQLGGIQAEASLPLPVGVLLMAYAARLVLFFPERSLSAGVRILDHKNVSVFRYWSSTLYRRTIFLVRVFRLVFSILCARSLVSFLWLP